MNSIVLIYSNGDRGIDHTIGKVKSQYQKTLLTYAERAKMVRTYFEVEIVADIDKKSSLCIGREIREEVFYIDEGREIVA